MPPNPIKQLDPGPPVYIIDIGGSIIVLDTKGYKNFLSAHKEYKKIYVGWDSEHIKIVMANIIALKYRISQLELFFDKESETNNNGQNKGKENE